MKLFKRFIWSNYSSRDYITFFNEDWIDNTFMEINRFNKTVDHHTELFWNAAYKSKVFERI